ncbi:MAG: hypothetical protein R2867_14630 [Caldilineaceae bacterium]
MERTIFGTLINRTLTVLAAYPRFLRFGEWVGRHIFMWIVLIAMLFNGGLIPWFLVIRNLGLLNSLWALILPGALPALATLTLFAAVFHWNSWFAV